MSKSRPSERCFTAEIASPGLAHGVLHVLAGSGRSSPVRAAGPRDEERKAFEAAIAAVAEELTDLARSAGKAAAEVVGRQIEFLSDQELIGPVLEAIEGGEPAWTAFRDAVDLAIAERRSGASGAGPEDLTDVQDRVLRRLNAQERADPAALPDGAVVVAETLTVSRFLEIDWRRVRGAVSFTGSRASHVSLLARARGVPLLLRPDLDPAELQSGMDAVLDGEAGRLVLAPSKATGRDYDRQIAERRDARERKNRWLSAPAVTADGTTIRVCLNVDDPAPLEGVDPAHCDGIGLARSEFLFSGADGPPNEERQYRVYRVLLAWAGGLPVTVRTLDAGGDKPVPGLTPAGEDNPVLGLRGLRLSLARAEVFRVQLRALARAAVHGPLRVMVPMVALPEELNRARALLAEEVTGLEQAGIAARLPEFGMMVETPAAALGIAEFDADFFSIGTNDLVQFVMAADRNNPAVAGLLDPLNPAVLELIGRVCKRGRGLDVEVGLCGEAASRPECIPALLEAGVRTLSVTPAALAEVKEAVAACRLERER